MELNEMERRCEVSALPVPAYARSAQPEITVHCNAPELAELTVSNPQAKCCT
jgi:hypothetical protein